MRSLHIHSRALEIHPTSNLLFVCDEPHILHVCVCRYSLGGLVVMILCVRVNSRISRRLKSLQSKKSEASDSRVKQMSEMVEGVKIMKFNASVSYRKGGSFPLPILPNQA